MGALMHGIPVENNQFAGGAFDWLHPFPVLTGIATLVFGYTIITEILKIGPSFFNCFYLKTWNRVFF